MRGRETGKVSEDRIADVEIGAEPMVYSTLSEDGSEAGDTQPSWVFCAAQQRSPNPQPYHGPILAADVRQAGLGFGSPSPATELPGRWATELIRLLC